MTTIRLPGQIQGDYVKTGSGTRHGLVRKDAIDGQQVTINVKVNGETLECVGTVAFERDELGDDTLVLRDVARQDGER